MSYEVLLHPKAQAALEKSETELKSRIRAKLRTLRSNPEGRKRRKHSDFWSLRIGDYRAVYEIDHTGQRVIILFIGHRKEVYDDFSRLV